nr:hypothetical protein CFP56_55955 [Quercus suber]
MSVECRGRSRACPRSDASGFSYQDLNSKGILPYSPSVLKIPYLPQGVAFSSVSLHQRNVTRWQTCIRPGLGLRFVVTSKQHRHAVAMGKCCTAASQRFFFFDTHRGV